MTAEMEKSNANSFQPPSPLPSWEPDQALSGHLVWAVATSGWPWPATEEDEGAPVIVEEEKNPDMDDKPWQRRDVGAPWEEATGCEFDQAAQVRTVKEASPRRAGSHQEFCQQEVAVRVQWGHGAQHQLYQRLPRPTSQELPQEEEEEVSDPELSQQGEGSKNSQEMQARSPVPSEEEVSSGGAQSPDTTRCPLNSLLGLLAAMSPSEQEEEAEEGSLLTEEGSTEETPAGEDEDWQHNSQTQPSQERQGETEPQLSQEELCSSQDLSEWEDFIEPELYKGEFLHGDSSSSAEGDNGSRDSTSIFTFRDTPSPLEEDRWDKLSLLELYDDRGRAQSLAVPVPREAWVEGQAPESLSASLSSLHSQDSVVQLGPEAGPQSPGPALHGPSAQAPRRWPALFRKWPGRLRRELRALFRWLCPAPRPQE